MAVTGCQNRPVPIENQFDLPKRKLFNFLALLRYLRINPIT